MNDLCSKDKSNACWTPGNFVCALLHKKKSKRLKDCSYLHSLSFSVLILSTVNTDSETAVVNVTYGTREQARQWVNFALKPLFWRWSVSFFLFFTSVTKCNFKNTDFCQVGFPCLPLFGQTDSLLKLTPCRCAGLVWILNVLKMLCYQ